jgi:hypothetical protein
MWTARPTFGAGRFYIDGTIAATAAGRVEARGMIFDNSK